MRRIKEAFDQSNNPLLNVYFTAGFPEANSTISILKELENSGVDVVEIGIPYSDPLADGPTIQKSLMKALQNGMSIEVLFDQLTNVRDKVQLPILLMGYLNPIMQFGIEAFCERCEKVGIDGLIIPDLPMEMFDSEFSDLANRYKLDFIFLVTPETSEERIRDLDKRCTGFIYMVSSSSTTGSTGSLSDNQMDYFERIERMKLTNKRMIGFGISDNHTFKQATKHADGAIIGSAFIKQLEKDSAQIASFIKGIKSP